MIPVSKAIDIIKRQTGVHGAERIELADSVGRVLAENIVADCDMPPFDRSQMDGFAVTASDTKNAPVTLKIVGESAAGSGWHKTMKRGQAVRIMTGAPVPAGADALARIEITSGTETEVTILEAVKKGIAIVQKGSEIKKGRVVIKRGSPITPNNIATLSAFGYAKVKVGKRPTVAILGTGSEIVDIHKKPGRDQIRNSNSVMLKAMAEQCGAVPETFPIANDDISNLKSQISNAAKNKDILIITGGVSVGKYDLTKAALIELGAKIFFEKVRLKPGKPAVFARLGKTLVFGLPGNPVSAAVTFQLFVRKAIMQLQGSSETVLKKGFAGLAADAKAARDRDTYLPSRLETDETGRLVAVPLRSQGSSDFVGFAQADSLVFLASGQTARAGETVDIVFL
ncbi:MAG TPA: molybdopterin molybdotransferase MoeA [Pyrinomonadaceae bacterium]|nr:molybdopterin molybdotransferase MoeA [Pyrinomonadaceae bacterium]